MLSPYVSPVVEMCFVSLSQPSSRDRVLSRYVSPVVDDRVLSR